MKTLQYHGCFRLFLAVLIIVSWLGAGCATGPKIDWNSRVGNYTYDQAVLELGPPDKSAKLTDGTLVGEWLQYRGYSRGSIRTFPGFHGSWIEHYQEPPAPDRFIRLTFGPDGTLRTWQRVLK